MGINKANNPVAVIFSLYLPCPMESISIAEFLWTIPIIGEGTPQ
jgi:hypothetical protein